MVPALGMNVSGQPPSDHFALTVPFERLLQDRVCRSRLDARCRDSHFVPAQINNVVRRRADDANSAPEISLLPILSLDQANRIISAALAEGLRLGLKPLSVAVLDSGGHLVAFQRQDGASTLRPQIAAAKAGGALALGVSSRKIAEMAGERPAFIGSLAGLSPCGVIPAAGGVIVIGEGGRPIGAVGITGDTSDNDETCAVAGIVAVGLIAQ